MATGPVALVILDGWGVAPPGPGNAVELAESPTFDALVAAGPHTTMAASGLDVGLPSGQIGNSEVGHLNLGAGRVVYQDLTRIDRAIEDGSFARNEVLASTYEAARSGRGVLHVIGLASFGGVHSHLAHLVEVVRAAARAGVREVRVHAITDGRDVAPDASLHDMPWLEAQLGDIAGTFDGCSASVATVIGRYWAMDRDHRWDRTQRAFDLLVGGVGIHAPSAREAVRTSHAAGVTDEFVEPHMIGVERDGIDPGDAIVFINFRPDRMRQLVPALTAPTFAAIDRPATWRPVTAAACLCEYDPTMRLPVAFPPDRPGAVLADVLESAGVGQLHVAETEKYAHVTYFFNGGVEPVHAGEVRSLANSPRDVATYDLKPEMAAEQVADLVVAGVADPAVGFVIVNLANPDMVGHTGVLPAAIAACEAADRALARIVAAVHGRGGTCLVTADHGNAETMLTPEGKPHTAHTTNPVPVVLAPAPGSVHGDVTSLRPGGRLADVAPTLLDLLGIAQPVQMTGVSLLVR